jgi:hypothetical protein
MKGMLLLVFPQVKMDYNHDDLSSITLRPSGPPPRKSAPRHPKHPQLSQYPKSGLL